MANTLAQLLESLFGIRTYDRESDPAFQVLATVTQVLPYNPNRLGIVFVNTGGSNVYLSPRNTVAVGRGIRLAANGGMANLKWDEEFQLVASEWHGIADGAASNFYYLEILSQQVPK